MKPIKERENIMNAKHLSKKTSISGTGSQNYILLKHNDNHITQQIHQLFITEMKPAKNFTTVTKQYHSTPNHNAS